MASSPLAVTHFTDPGCPWAYSASPAFAALNWRYGDQLDWTHVTIGLREDPPTGYSPARQATFGISFGAYGMPFGSQPRERLAATGRACRAMVATRLVDPKHELAALRALQFAQFTTTALFDTDEGIHEALSTVPGLDADAVVAAIGREDVEAAYQADRARTRSAAGGPTEFQGKSANSDGAVRFTAPSLIFTAQDGRSLEAGGFQPLEAYDVAIANLDTTLTRRAPGEDVVEILEAFDYPLTTAEVAAIQAAHLTAPDRDAAEVALVEATAAGSVSRTQAGNGALWSLAH
jgi:2-hydroxychromene-2-carboxylate isomerase